MQFKTLRYAERGSDRFAQPAGPRWLSFSFDYEASRNPASESINVQIGDDLARSGEAEYWDNIRAGVSLGLAEAARQGTRLCCIDLTILRTEIDDVATSPAVVESRLAGFVHERLVRGCERVLWCPDWLTSDMIALAKGIHADAATDRYPILSDALRDAGCEDSLVHEHLQQCPDHSPSCWVVEMILNQARPAGN